MKKLFEFRGLDSHHENDYSYVDLSSVVFIRPLYDAGSECQGSILFFANMENGMIVPNIHPGELAKLAEKAKVESSEIEIGAAIQVPDKKPKAKKGAK